MKPGRWQSKSRVVGSVPNGSQNPFCKAQENVCEVGIHQERAPTHTTESRGAAVGVGGPSWTTSPRNFTCRERVRGSPSRNVLGSTHVSNVWGSCPRAASQVPTQWSQGGVQEIALGQTPRGILININLTRGKLATPESENWEMGINGLTSFPFPLRVPKLVCSSLRSGTALWASASG